MNELPQRYRVLILATRVPLESGDGTPSFVLDNAMSLSRDFDIVVLTPRVRGASGSSSQEGVRVRRFAYFPLRWERLADEAIMPQLSRDPTLWFQALTLVVAMFANALTEHRRHRFDVVHAQWIVPSGLVASLLRLTSRVPYLITAQGADVFRLNRGPLRSLKRLIINRSTRFIGVSNDIAKFFTGLTVPVEVQPSGVDFALWKQLVGENDPQPGRVLFVGRLDEKKGVADAIKAIAGLNDVRLVIVGDGPLRDRLECLASDLGVKDQVVFRGQLNRTEVAGEMRTATCIILPAVTAGDGDKDGTPNVLGEAIAAGVPVVGSRIAGIAEFVTHQRTGLLFEAGDVEALRGCLREILRGENLPKFVHEAEVQFRPSFDIDHVARRYASWYKSAAGW